MPKIFEYLGFIFFFYSNDHEPIHCHVKKGDKEVKVDFTFEKDKLVSVSIRKYKNSRRVLTSSEREKIREFVEIYYKEIRKKWEDFRADKEIKFEKITKLKNDNNE